ERVAKLGFKAAAVRPCFWNGRYPTLAEFDPLWRAFESTGLVLAMHTFPSREALTHEWGQRMAQARGHSGQGLLFTDESVVYSPGQFVSNITAAMDPAIDASETLGFLMEAMTWVTVVVQTGWLEKFPKLKAAVLESNASWLPLILARSSNFSNLFAFQRDNRLIRDPVEVFNERCFIGFESDETLVYRLWDVFQDVAIWSSDYPHHDAEDAWDGLHHLAEFKVPAKVQRQLMGENARRLYGIEPVMAVVARYPAPFYDPFVTLAWLARVTTRVELGTTVVILPYRHPLHTARLGANIDRLSGGRFIFGVGVGWAKQEFATLGVPFERRGAMSNDYLAAIKTAWTSDPASYNGPFVSFRDVHTGPRPVRSPHPPIWVGGASDAALRRAVRLGNAWHPIRVRIPWLRDTGLPKLREIADKEGRPLPALCPRIRLRVTDTKLADDQRIAGEGSLDQVRADLEALARLGASYVLFDTYTDDAEATRHHETAWRMLALVAERVLDLGKETLR